jgi:hypothetical protein
MQQATLAPLQGKQSQADSLPRRIAGEGTSCLIQGVRAFSREDCAVSIHRHTLTRSALIDTIFALERWNKAGNVVMIDMTDAYTVAPANVIGRTGLGVDRVKHIVFGNKDATDPAEHIAGLEVITLLVEDL